MQDNDIEFWLSSDPVPTNAVPAVNTSSDLPNKALDDPLEDSKPVCPSFITSSSVHYFNINLTCALNCRKSQKKNQKSLKRRRKRKKEMKVWIGRRLRVGTSSRSTQELRETP